MQDLGGKTAFITGGGGGIGGGMAEAFVEAGMTVVLADISLDFAQEKADELGDAAMAVALDVTDPASWQQAKDEAQARFGAIDLLCNNAGISHPFGSLLDLAEESFDAVMAINVRGVFLGVQALVPAMVERGRGHVVNTSSVNGLIPHGPFAAYSASKFAVLGLSDSLRQELAPKGVGVSTLFPGLTRSRMSLRIKEDHGLDEEAFAAIEANMMDPLWMGRAVRRAVERDMAYIITHPDHRQALEARHGAILEAFGKPAEPGYGASAGTVGART